MNAADPGPDPFGLVARPTTIRLRKAEKILDIEFDDNRRFSYPAELLRVESPSAEVQGHSADQKQIVAGRRHVGIMKIEAVGNYAISIMFDDLHETGIFSWRYLYELGIDMENRWNAYLAELDAHGLGRDP